MRQYRWRVLAGEVWTLGNVAVGTQFRFDRNDDGRTVTGTATAVTDAEGTVKVTWTAPTVESTVYVACREKSTDPYQPIGTIDVRTLVDRQEEQLRTEVEDLDRRILALESTHVQTQAPDGLALTRVSLPALRRQRALAWARLQDHRRRKSGLLPGRMV